jgi:hypothetical protein
MKKIALFTLAASASLALSACGRSDDASDAATPDTVEMPAEEQLNTVAAEPVPDSGEAATAPADPNAGAAPEDAAANAAAAAADFQAAGGEGAEKAIDQAEKKM